MSADATRTFYHYAPKSNAFKAVCGNTDAPRHRLTFYVSEVTCAVCKKILRANTAVSL